MSSFLSALRPPEWVVDELQNRVVLFLNHVLQQEPAAMERLKRQQGKPVRVRWTEVQLTLAATPAGLLERCDAAAVPELTVTLTDSSPLALAQALLSGQKPGTEIQGDVQLAAEVAWLSENVRWDVEEDLARVLGDAPAHTLASVARRVVDAAKAFAARVPRPGQGDGGNPGGPAA